MKQKLPTTTTILKSRDFLASDLAEYIFGRGHFYNVDSLKDAIAAYLRVNSVEKNKPKVRPKKEGRRKQLELGLERKN